ncbi:MAG: hypothetical protein KAU22_05310 [Desulfuromonadales bacterium]|nr:hypothetical protein [Desulfuromonadales bacterium]
MQIDLQKLLNYLLLGLSIIGGITAGMLAVRVIDLSLGGETILPADPVPRQASVRQLQESDFQVILDRNLFDSAGGEMALLDLSSQAITTTAVASPAKVAGDLVLIGTVVAGEESLAVIKSGAKVKVFQLHEELSPQVIVSEIGRQMVVIMDHGSRRELPLKQRKSASAQLISPGSKAAAKGGIVATDENSWQISKAVVANARANLNSLLQSARMVPQIDNGQTVGFKVVELKAGSLLQQIGLQVGDLVVRINQVELNSPEKALQVFQQVREANNLSLGLVRNGQPKTFEYSFE